MNALGLYVHVPFCRGKCGYCAFNSRPLRDDAELAAYARALETEFAMYTARLADAQVTTIYFGGGTPSLLAPEQIASLLTRMRPVADAEITLEANPETVTERTLAGFRAAGVNRLSLGVQSFDAAALAFLERRHQPNQAVDAFTAARRTGFANISLDLIAGLPAPHDRAYLADLDAPLSLAPEHLSVYLLTAEPPSRLHEAACAGRVTLPAADQQADVFLRVHERLTASSFEHYEVSNFARPEKRARHNSAYWRGAAYLGFGAGAHSFVAHERRANVGDPDEYVRRLARGDSPVAFRETITPEMSRREKLMLELRTAEGVDPREFGDAAPALAAALSRHAAEGRYTRDGSRFCPTVTGFLVADGIALELWETLESK